MSKMMTEVSHRGLGSTTIVCSYLSENAFTTAIKGVALLIKSHVVSSAIDRAGSITLFGRALPLHVFTSAVNRYALDCFRLIIKDTT